MEEWRYSSGPGTYKDHYYLSYEHARAAAFLWHFMSKHSEGIYLGNCVACDFHSGWTYTIEHTLTEHSLQEVKSAMMLTCLGRNS